MNCYLCNKNLYISYNCIDNLYNCISKEEYKQELQYCLYPIKHIKNLLKDKNINFYSNIKKVHAVSLLTGRHCFYTYFKPSYLKKELKILSIV